MLHQKIVHIQGSEASAEKDEYVYLHKKDDEMKNDKSTVENETIVGYGNDFRNCKIIHSKQ